MILIASGVIPLLGFLAAFGGHTKQHSVGVLITCAGLSFMSAILGVAGVPGSEMPQWTQGYLLNDASSRLFLLLISSIFLGTAFYVYNRVLITPAVARDIHKYVRLALLFFAGSVFAVLSNHFLLTWILLEATTLAAAPLVYHQKGAESFRAAWKYLLFSSVSLGLSFLGFLCLSHGMGGQGLFISDLMGQAVQVNGLWRPLGVALVVFGFCAKLGLAPLYAWLPETYDCAPPSVTTLLAAVQFNCVLLALFRFLHVFRSLEPTLIRMELLTLGLASIVVATLNIVVAKNFKRLIAYASINHAGVIAIGLGLGKSASFGVVLYMLSNALIKAILFLTSGNIKARFHTKNIADLHGLIKGMPFSGWFFMIGIFALLGFAPFASFFGEVIIMTSMIEQRSYVVFSIFCILLMVIFVATGRSIFPMIWGEPGEEPAGTGETIYALAPNLFFIFLLMVLGIYIPTGANSILQEVARTLGGR